MTSTASQQNPITAPNTTTAAPSYASAASSIKKASTTPVVASGSNPSGPPVVVGSAQNGKPALAPVNGRPAVTPAVPAVPAAPPAVARSSASVNGAAGHDRKSSVTIPPNVTQNGGPVGGANIPKFGFDQSPAVVHSTPQPGVTQPIPIPSASARNIPSPVQSPAPIPQAISGGQQRPISNTGTIPTFGSFPGDNERTMKQPSGPPNHMPMGSPQPHFVHNHLHGRKDSQASSHGGDFGNLAGPPPNRGGYGRGRGGYAGSYSNMGFPPSQHSSYGGGGKGRGNIPAPFQSQGRMPPFPNSPSQARASPATTPAMPHQTPTMQQAVPMSQGPGYYPALYQQQQMNHQYMPPVNPYAQPMMPYGYQAQQGPFMAPPVQPAPHGFHQPYQGAQFPHSQPGAQPMSRNNSQVSERPPSSTSQTQATPTVQGTPQIRPAQVAPPVVSSNFTRPKLSKAIIIKNDKGEVVDFTAQAKPPVSPASIVPSKTPPVVSSTPTPPPKPLTPSHTRNESASIKTAEQLRNEFKDAVANSANQKAREEEAGKVAAEKLAREEKEKEDKALEEQALQEKAKEDERQKEKSLKEAESIAAEKQADEEAEAATAAEEQRLAKEQVEADTKATEKADVEAETTVAKANADDQETARDEPSDQAATQNDAQPLDEAAQTPARRQPFDMAEIQKKIAAAQAAREAEAATLLEKEREAERYEEEMERKRQEKAANAPQVPRPSLAEMLRNRAAAKAKEAEKEQAESQLEAKGTAETKPIENKASEPLTPDSAVGQPGFLTISGDGAVGSKTYVAEKHRAKPAALNLSPINTKQVDPPQPSAAIQSLKSARFLSVLEPGIYPQGIASPNPALNKAVATKGKSFKYDAAFLLQFQKVFTEQPSMEFHQQVKSLIGDTEARSAPPAPRPGVGPRQGSRPGGNAAGPGGATFSAPMMGQFVSKPLPPGLTSEQRFAISRGTMPRPTAANPMASFGRNGGFPGPGELSRTPSSSNMGGVPNSPRQGSRSQRGGSRRGDVASKAADEKAAKTMPLTQGMDLKPLAPSASGWKPKSIVGMAGPVPGGGQSGHIDPETVQRKVKAALNKMTPEKFDRIADQILAIASQSKDEQDGRTLRQVIQLTFEKATDESHWASMYAKFCKRMLDTMSSDIRDENILDKAGQVVSGGALFRKYLLNRCQEEFERGWKVDLPAPKEGEFQDMMSDEYYIAAAAKRRGLGLIQFIGELFKLGMLTERIMHECVRKLLEFQGVPDEAEIESLSKLLRTVGANLDSTEKGHPMMDVYFQRISSIIELPELPSRLKFMLLDVVDLRKMRWVDANEASKGPKTMEELRADTEAQEAQKAAEVARANSQRGPSGRSQGGRDSRNFSYQQAPTNNQVGADDLRRLRVPGNRSSSQNMSFGPPSLFTSRSNSGRRLGPTSLRAGEDLGAPSRTGTPPTRERDSIAHTNAFGALAMADNGEHPASPPSAAASPALSKAALETSASREKKE